MTILVLGAHELERAAQLLTAGSVVGIPTDTVYGLAAALDHELAVAALFEAKRRPDAVPIAVLVGSVDEAAALAVGWDDRAARLAGQFWPGPLTMVVAATAALCGRLRAPRGVGLRVPDDPTCLALLERTGPLAVTSANLHGEPPATTAAQVAAVFADPPVAAVLDGGPRDGAVSSVVDLTGAACEIIRDGALARDVLLAAISRA